MRALSAVPTTQSCVRILQVSWPSQKYILANISPFAYSVQARHINASSFTLPFTKLKKKKNLTKRKFAKFLSRENWNLHGTLYQYIYVLYMHICILCTYVCMYVCMTSLRVCAAGSPVEKRLVQRASEEHIQQVALSDGEPHNSTSKLEPTYSGYGVRWRKPCTRGTYIG